MRREVRSGGSGRNSSLRNAAVHETPKSCIWGEVAARSVSQRYAAAPRDGTTCRRSAGIPRISSASSVGRRYSGVDQDTGRLRDRTPAGGDQGGGHSGAGSARSCPVGPHAHRHAVELFQPDGQCLGRVDKRFTLAVGPQGACVCEHSVRVGAEMPSRTEHHATGNLDARLDHAATTCWGRGDGTNGARPCPGGRWDQRRSAGGSSSR